MDPIIAELVKYSPQIGGALVTLVGLWLKLRNDRQDPAAVRVLKQHAKLHESLPESTRGPIEGLIKFEAEKYAAAQIRRGTRKMNWTSFFTLVVIACLTGASVSWMISLALVWWPAWIIAGLAAAFGGALMAAGTLQLFTYGDAPSDAPADPGRAGEEARELEKVS